MIQWSSDKVKVTVKKFSVYFFTIEYKKFLFRNEGHRPIINKQSYYSINEEWYTYSVHVIYTPE